MQSPFANTPAQYISQQAHAPSPSPSDGPVSQGDESEQRVQAALYKIKELKGELQQAYNPYSLKQCLEGTLNLIEYVLGGQVTAAHSNQVPGAPVATQDPNAARVAFSTSAPHATPGSPINNGDVQFTPGPPAAATPVAGQQPNGQTVEYYGGPAGTPYESGSAQKVEFYAGPGAGQQAQPPSTTQQHLPQNPPQPQPQPQQPPQVPSPPPHDPRAGMPVQPGQPSPNNPTGATFTPGVPPVSVEAGHSVPQGATAAPAAPPAAVSTVPPDRPLHGDPQANLTPEQIASMPLPVAEVTQNRQPEPNQAPQSPPQNQGAMPIPSAE